MTDVTVWERLAAPLAPADISWRIDSKPTLRNGKHFARFVCYVEAGTVRKRLDEVAPGEWSVTLAPLKESHDADSVPVQAFCARLRVRGVTREDVGQGPDYKQASTDAFKRVAVRFGIGHELYAMEQNWVEVDGDGKFAKPVEDPQQAYDRRYGSGKQNGNPTSTASVRITTTPSNQPSTSRAPQSFDPDAVSCPKCGGSSMYDNRAENAQRVARGEKARPDFKCKSRGCDGIIWPPKDKEPTRGNAMDANDYEAPPAPPSDVYDSDPLPF